MCWGGGPGALGCVELELDPCPVSGSLSTLGRGWRSQEQPELGDVLPLVLNSWWFGHFLDTLSKCHTLQGGHLAPKSELLLAKFSIKLGCPKWRLVLSSSFVGNPRMV